MLGNKYYRVMNPFVAVTNLEQSHGTFTTVPTGAIIEIQSDLQEPGLVEIRLRDQTLWAFTRDIQERSERLVQERSEKLVESLPGERQLGQHRSADT